MTKILSFKSGNKWRRIQLNKKYLILYLLLIFLVSAAQSLAQNANNTSVAANNSSTTEVLAAANETAPSNGTAQENGNESSTQAADLKYVWSVTGIESEKITMVLNQDGKDLFGQAKYEPDSGKKWNAEVVGSIEENDVELTLSAQKDKEMVTTKMTGIFDDTNQTISGSFSQVSQGKIVNKGNFSAMWISPDTSSYKSAVIEEINPATSVPAAVNTTATNVTGQTIDASKKSRFTDVHEYAEKMGVGGDLSGVPIGMGGAGGTSS
jgi:hypothetical protein